MANYRLLTGPFEGEVIEEGRKILDLAFEDLDTDLQLRIRTWAEDNYPIVGGEFVSPGGSDLPVGWRDIIEAYECSWDAEETDEPVSLLPVSAAVTDP